MPLKSPVSALSQNLANTGSARPARDPVSHDPSGDRFRPVSCVAGWTRGAHWGNFGLTYGGLHRA